ncbi:MAG: hypothetical protein NTV73_09945 [Hyphomicrobiales bacterium]|nr:hypothetical protein [Hyphomicrobiales bacterium]
MSQRMEELRRDGVCLAQTVEGFYLPVLDVTHPRFALADNEASYESLRRDLLETERRNRRLPRFITRLMLKMAARRSRLVKAMFASGNDVLDSLNTYVMKLGPDNLLPPYQTAMDERFVAAPHAAFIRLRTQQVATLLARHLAKELAASGPRPLHLINIAGGPAVDSLNTLIILARDHPRLLDIPIVIHVLDLDPNGPVFGANALAAAQADGSRLGGLDATFRYVPYDWNDTAPLRLLLDELRSLHAVIACSSEGGLFEYGSDEAIVANLEVLGACGVCCIAGSVTRSAQARRNLTGADRFKVIARGLENFERLSSRADFAIAETRPGIFSDQVLLLPVQVAPTR